MKLCHTCKRNEKLVTLSSLEDIPQDLKTCNFPIDKRPDECKISYPPSSDIQLTLFDTSLKKGTKIFYWAAKPKKLSEQVKKIEGLKKSYCEKNNNYGCCKVGNNGKIIIKIMSPQCYKEDGKVWPKHLHFIKEDRKNWDLGDVYTALAVPSYSEKIETKRLRYGGVYITPATIKRTWKDGHYYMVYALSKKNPSLIDIEKYKDCKHLCIDHESKTISIPSKIKKSTPLVVYCARESCNAAKKLIVKLADKGYENLFYMPAGMMDFSKESRDIFLRDKEEKNMKSYKKMVKLYK